MFNKIKTTTAEPKERLVIISDNGTADIANVYDIDHERVAASSSSADYSVPVADLKAYAGSRGIIYVYAASHENIEDTQRLAALEKSIVLQQVTHYIKPDPEESKMTFMKLFPYILIFLLVIIVAVK